MQRVSTLGSKLKIVLASTSPRRKELMNGLGIEFEVVEPESDETSIHPDPEKKVIENAEAKARSVFDQYSDALVIGADTVVFLDGVFLGKPVDTDDARMMLNKLSGRTHQVFTGVAIIDTSTGSMVSGVEETLVTFQELSEEDIAEYVAGGEPLDKAGAYGIQGAASVFVDEVNGSWSNVVGLPLELLRGFLNKILG